MRPLKPLHVALLLVAALQGLLWYGWGSPTPIYDEAGYLSAGEAVAAWLRCAPFGSCADESATSLGRLLWHNPGYSALFVLAELLPGDAASWIRGLQMVAGLLAGAWVHALLVRPVGKRGALLAAAVVWLHPVQLFFRLTLWPVALATAGFALVVLLAARLARDPSPAAQLRLGGAVLGLTLLHPLSLAALPLLGVWLMRQGERPATPATTGQVLLPSLLVWAALFLVTSAALGMTSFGLLAGPENRALGNNPWISAHRGSSLHDSPSVRRLRAQVDRACPGLTSVARLRCEAQEYRAIADGTVRADPVGATRRAALRLVETWSPDRYVARHLSDPRVSTRWTPPPAATAVVGGAEVLTLLMLVLVAAGARDRRVLAIAIAAALCTVPAVAGVGLSRLRQPLLPLLVLGASLTLARYHRRR